MALAAVLIAGAAAGAGAMRFVDRHQSQAVMVLQPSAINTLRDNTIAAIKGKVANTFGNAFIVDDGTGRTLVDTGPRGEGRIIVTPDETVTVQGRFDGGRLHAQVLMHADGRTEGFGPDKPPTSKRGPGDAGPGRPASAPADMSVPGQRP
jgi:uncharacterized protein YdeI (BOF family)